MYKKTTVNKEVETTKKYCDVCGNEIHIGLACSAIKCGQCKKDLCEKCIGYEESDCGDYRYGYCERCWNIGQPFLNAIEQCSDRIEELHGQWTSECEKVINNESNAID